MAFQLMAEFKTGEMNMSETIKLDALPNACIFKKPCAICGVWDRPNAPWWVFLDGDISRPVCG
ncbi:MAG: hypothetical protein ACOWWM_16740, partial [Desulfobacterales bacterium]